MADEADEPQGDERIRDPTAATESLNPLWDSSIVVTNPAAATLVRLKGRGWQMLSEAKTRAERIDLQLAKAGWTRDSRCLVEEMPLPRGSQPIRDPSAPYGSADAFADYALLDRLNRPLAVVEAKRSSRSPVEGERQAAEYADRIRDLHGVDPFIFLANGDEIWF